MKTDTTKFPERLMEDVLKVKILKNPKMIAIFLKDVNKK